MKIIIVKHPKREAKIYGVPFFYLKKFIAKHIITKNLR